MVTAILAGATAFVVGSCATFVGNGIYEVSRVALDYYVLDRENGVDAHKKAKNKKKEDKENE